MSAAKKQWLLAAICLVLGGAAYGMIEVLFRGYTHFSMVITGGVCCYLLCRIARMEGHWLRLALLGGLTVTAVEFVVGCVVNLWLGWNVWDYSGSFANILGQVCLTFTLIWCGFSAAITGAYRLGRRWIKAFHTA